MQRHLYTPALFIASLLLPMLSHGNHVEGTLMGGAIFSQLSNNKSVQVHPLVTNLYEADEEMKSGSLAGATVAYAFEGWEKHHIALSLGLSGYYLNYGEVEGTEYPFANAGSFDTLDYQFNAHSFALMLEPKLVYTQFAWQPYFFVGIGSAWNRLSDYDEKPSNPAGSAAPAAQAFSSKTVNAFAYELGIGVQHEFAHRAQNMFRYRLAADYRYMNLGHADLGTMPGQLTSDHLHVSPLSTQALVVSFTTLF